MFKDFVKNVTNLDSIPNVTFDRELADRSERWWFKQTVADKVSFVSKSYYSVNTGSPCASIFFPMYDE